MNKEQLRAIVSYSYARYGTICANTSVVVDSIELAAHRNNCKIDDVINAFVDFDESAAFALAEIKHGEELVNYLIGFYLYSKAVKQ